MVNYGFDGWFCYNRQQLIIVSVNDVEKSSDCLQFENFLIRYNFYILKINLRNK